MEVQCGHFSLGSKRTGSASGADSRVSSLRLLRNIATLAEGSCKGANSAPRTMLTSPTVSPCTSAYSTAVHTPSASELMRVSRASSFRCSDSSVGPTVPCVRSTQRSPAARCRGSKADELGARAKDSTSSMTEVKHRHQLRDASIHNAHEQRLPVELRSEQVASIIDTIAHIGVGEDRQLCIVLSYISLVRLQETLHCILHACSAIAKLH
eukprot:4993194-Amphidinium_carterae.1